MQRDDEYWLNLNKKLSCPRKWASIAEEKGNIWIPVPKGSLRGFRGNDKLSQHPMMREY